MTKADIKHFQRQLLALQHRLGDNVSGLENEALRPMGGQSGGNLSDVPLHPADLGSENYEEEIALDLLENEQNILFEVSEALDRIEKGTFGRCEECGTEIPRERLEALPYTRHCVRCAHVLQTQGVP